MQKYLLRYLVFWAPAFVVAVFFCNNTMPSQIAQFFCAFFMLFGWLANTGMAARRYPRNTLTFILLYSGVSLILTELLYRDILRQYFGNAYYMVGGIFSYVPMDIIIQKTLDFKIQHETYIVAGIAAFCLIGWLFGLFISYHNPNPARPRIHK